MHAPRIMSTLLFACFFCISSAYAAQIVPITVCYQTIAAHQIGQLQQDLTCDGSGGPNVTLQPGARLQLNGHSITGGYLGVGVDPGKHKTIIEGPGEIFGEAGSPPIFGCAISTATSTIIRNVDLHDNACGITAYYTAPLKLEDVTVRNNSGDGVNYTLPVGHGRVKRNRLTVTDNGGTGILAYRQMTLKEVIVTGNGSGGAVAGTNLTVRDSTLTGNGAGGDVAASMRMRVTNTTCDHSVNTGGGTFGVCSLD